MGNVGVIYRELLVMMLSLPVSIPLDLAFSYKPDPAAAAAFEEDTVLDALVAVIIPPETMEGAVMALLKAPRIGISCCLPLPPSPGLVLVMGLSSSFFSSDCTVADREEVEAGVFNPNVFSKL